VLHKLVAVFNDGGASVRSRLLGVYGLLLILNVGGWIWALAEFWGNAAALGVALVVYGLGLRHAVDADHIAAIDNVTRKLMQNGERPVAVGFFFALGHSTIVILATAILAAAASTLDVYAGVGGLIATFISTFFLLAIAVMNLVILNSIVKTYREVRSGGAYVAEDFDLLLNKRGFLARIFRPLFKMVTKSWLMYPLGFAFGLGFDTATEIAVFGLSAAQVAKGMSVAAIIVFPVLFAAGMALVDTTDGVLMLRAYDWAYVKPMRKLFYNITITGVSVVVALVIGGIEGLGLIADQLGMEGGLWDGVAYLNENFNSIGFLIIGIFIVAWLISFVVYKVKRLDDFEVALAPGKPPVLEKADTSLRVQAAE
jgi:high-affinity nickel-transport protein